MRFDRFEKLGGCIIFYFKNEEVERLPLTGNGGKGLTELPKRRNPAEGVVRHLGGPFLTKDEAVDERYQEKNRIA